MRMHNKLIGPLILIGAASVAFVIGLGNPPSHQVAEEVWRLEIVAPHVDKLTELLGPAADDLVEFEDFTITDIARRERDLFEISYQFSQRLTRPLSDLSHVPPGPMKIMKTVFPTGGTGETVPGSGFMKLKETDAGWALFHRSD